MSVNYGGRTDAHGLLNISDDLVGYLCGFLSAKRLTALSLCAKNYKQWIPVSSIRVISIPAEKARVVEEPLNLCMKFLERFAFTDIKRIAGPVDLYMRFPLIRCEEIASMLAPYLSDDCRVSLTLSSDVVCLMSTSCRFNYPYFLKLLGMADKFSAWGRSHMVDGPVPMPSDDNNIITFSELFPNAYPRNSSIDICWDQVHGFGPDRGRCSCDLWAPFALSAMPLGVCRGICPIFMRNHSVIAEQFKLDVQTNVDALLQSQRMGHELSKLVTWEIVSPRLEKMSAAEFFDFYLRSSSNLRFASDFDSIVTANLLKYSEKTEEGEQWMQVAEHIAIIDMRGHSYFTYYIGCLEDLPDAWFKRYLKTVLAAVKAAADCARSKNWQSYELFKSNLYMLWEVFDGNGDDDDNDTVRERSMEFMPDFPYHLTWETVLPIGLHVYRDQNSAFEIVDAAQ